MKKYLTVIFLSLLPLCIRAEEKGLSVQDTLAVSATEAVKSDPFKGVPSRVNVKLNGLVALTVINPVVEVRISKHFTGQLEFYGIFAPHKFLWTDYPLSLGIGYLDGRYYIKEAFKGFSAGVTVGYGVFRMNKNVNPFKVGSALVGEYPKETVQVGQVILLGITLGYTFNIGEHWGIEISLGGGWTQAYYEGYSPNEDNIVTERSKPSGGTDKVSDYYDSSISRVRMNNSAQWMPFKGGVFVCYKF